MVGNSTPEQDTGLPALKTEEAEHQKRESPALEELQLTETIWSAVTFSLNSQAGVKGL